MKLEQAGPTDLVERPGSESLSQPIRDVGEIAHDSSPPGDRRRIGMIAPPWFTTPPAGYGGTERVVALLADGLTRRGHHVTLFAPAGSKTLAGLEETFPNPMHRLIGSIAIEAQNVMAAYRNWRRFDLLHDHTVSGLGASSIIDRPITHTVHGPVLPDVRGALRLAPCECSPDLD